jgi:hypothetical protein
VKLVQHLDKCWIALVITQKIKHKLYLIVVLNLFGWVKFSDVYNKTVLNLKMTVCTINHY